MLSNGRFSAASRAVHLTEAGHAVLQFAELFDRELNNLKQAIASM